jgi:stage V sporulation protein G
MFNGVQVTKYQNGDPHLKGFAKVVVAGAVMLTGIRIIEGRNGLFVAMPQRETEVDGKVNYRDIYYPMNDSIRGDLEALVLNEYLKLA